MMKQYFSQTRIVTYIAINALFGKMYFFYHKSHAQSHRHYVRAMHSKVIYFQS